MLDADETAGFDEAMRHDPELMGAYREVECLTAVIAAVVTHPVKPQSGQLESLHLRLGLNVAKRTNWLGISGWAAAAVVLLLWQLPNRDKDPQNLTQRETRPVRVAVTKLSPPPAATVVTAAVASPIEETPPKNSLEKSARLITAPAELTAVVKRETRRLTQEIETLRSHLESAEARDRRLFEAVPGFSRPVVMRMKLPEDVTLASASEFSDGGVATEKTEFPLTEDQPIATVIGDALASAAQPKLKRHAPPPPAAVNASASLSAISVYDPALDTGTIVIAGDLPADSGDGPPQLWMVTDDGIPIYVGTLPVVGTQGAENTFDFSFGKPSTVPKGFILTKGSPGPPVPPTAANTLLVGPK
jgi:hypothetical protein